jgi:hypothetical protein
MLEVLTAGHRRSQKYDALEDAFGVTIKMSPLAPNTPVIK